MNNLFYTPNITGGFAHLDEEESRHLLTVLRRKAGDTMHLTDGKGHFFVGEIAEIGKKNATIRIISTQDIAEPTPRLHLAAAPTKNLERYEWLLEKAVEIGVHTITPVRCKRSERDTVRLDRLEKIIVSATKQSLHAWLPTLQPMTPFAQVVKAVTEPQRCIAWCAEPAEPHLKTVLLPQRDTILLIGPEGDFTPEEVALAKSTGFTGVGLGNTRLRTETAGVLATVIFNIQ